MPLYFFDVDSDDAHAKDLAGQQCPDAEAARQEALEGLSEMCKDRRDRGWRKLVVSVRDAHDKVVFTATSSFVEQWAN